MRRPLTTWAAVLGTLVAYDVWCAYDDVQGNSLSEVTRAALRTDTAEGKALFVLGWTALSAWFLPHILRADIDLARLTTD